MSQHLKIFFLTLLFAISMVFEIDAQRQKNPSKKITNIFSAGVLIGANLSQMDGDFFTGFDKSGISAGIKAYTHLSYKLNLNVEILYTQKGSKIPHGTIINSSSINDRKVGLNYIDIPVLTQIKLQPDKYNTFLEFGPVISRLVSTSIDEKNRNEFKGTSYNDDIESNLKPFELSALFGVGFHHKLYDFSIRYNYGISKIYSTEKKELTSSYSIAVKEVYFLRNYHLGFMLSFKI